MLKGKKELNGIIPQNRVWWKVLNKKLEKFKIFKRQNIFTSAIIKKKERKPREIECS